MVYESDFYTTRRPYRTTPSYSTYTTSFAPSRQVRILPGLGKVHVVHSYDRLIPYVGHKRLTVVTTPSPVFKVRPSVLWREYDRIEHKYRPLTYYSPTSAYLNSDSSVRMHYSPYTGTRYYTIYRPVRMGYINTYTSPYTGITYRSSYYPTSLSSLKSYYDYYYDWPNYGYSSYPYYNGLSYSYNYPYYYPYNKYDYSYYSYPSKFYMYRAFDDETRYIKAQAASLLKRVHTPLPRPARALPLPYLSTSSYDLTPSKYANDFYIQRLITSNPYNPKLSFTTYYTEPVRKFVGGGHLACIVYAADKAYPRRTFRTYDDPVKNDIQLLSYYIAKFRDRNQKSIKESKAQLDPLRPTRVFNPAKQLPDSVHEELRELKEQRAQRLAKIYAVDDEPRKPREDPVQKDIKKKEEERLAQLKAAEEEKARKDAEAKREAKARKEEEARKAELARQEELAAKAAAEKAAADKAAELERQAEQTRQEELAKQAELERIRKEDEERARLEEEKKAAELARQEEERQQLARLEEIARQAEEEKEADLARQADELAELARQEAELAEQQRLEDEAAETARKEAEAEEIAKREAELAELARQEQELVEQAEQARLDAEAAEREREEAELAELLRQQAELDALEAEAKAMFGDVVQPDPEDDGQEAVEAEESPAAEEEPTAEEPAAEEEVVEETAAAEEPAAEEAAPEEAEPEETAEEE